MKRILVSLLLTSLIICSGCLAAWVAGGAVAGVMIYSYVNNELERKYPSDPQTTWAACLKTVEELEFEIVDQPTKDAFSGTIQAKMANGTPIWINTKMETVDITSVRVRVGSEGDRRISEAIHDTIRKNLKLPDQPPYKEK